jgi:YVTN family beta-propeller protein
MRNTFGLAVLLLALLGGRPDVARAGSGKYLGPSVVLASKDGANLLVLNVDARQVAVVDAASAKVARTIALPAEPTGMTLSPDGGTLYVTCVTPLGTVHVIDVASGKARATIPAGHYAGAPVASPDGKRLYVCNRFNNNVSVIDLDAKKELARIPAVREPIAAAITSDGRTLVVANHLPNDRSDSYDVAATVQLVDAGKAESGNPNADPSSVSSAVRLPNGSTGVRGVCVSPDEIGRAHV